jgi:hypothetical protein
MEERFVVAELECARLVTALENEMERARSSETKESELRRQHQVVEIRGKGFGGIRAGNLHLSLFFSHTL